MGKLIETLEHVSQGSTSGFGFLGRARETTRKPRPAAIVVRVGVGDTAAATAAVQAGADVLLVTGWAPGTSLDALSGALQGTSAVWGVEVGGSGSTQHEIGKQASEAGASFIVLDGESGAGALFEQVEHLDRMLAVEPPKDELGLLLFRSQSLLPVQAALLRLDLSASDLAHLSISQFGRLQLIVESLRFPSLVTLREAPEAESVGVLVQMGAAGIVLSAERATPQAIETQVRGLREELEKTPIPRQERETILLGGLVGTAPTPAAAPGEPPTQPTRRDPYRREPEREPEHEPEREAPQRPQIP